MENRLFVQFRHYLIQEEKSSATIEKYLRDIRCFFRFLSGKEISKEKTIAFKEYLTQHYAPSSVNSMLVALNSFLRFTNRQEYCVKTLKIQRQIFSREERELSKAEYKRLIKAAANTRLSYIIQTICGTGIRVSELQYITTTEVQKGKAVVNCKGKMRIILIPAPVRELLKKYIKKAGIQQGSVFITKSGKPVNRSNIWRDMKNLCTKANVSEKKVFPHNLRHLFARIFYSLDKDIVRLADLLGHSSINTTRIYTIESGKQHLIQLEAVQKILTT